jgi:hypothetical protein
MKYILSFLLVILTNLILSQTTLLSTDFDEGIPANFTIVDNDNLIVHPDVVNFTEAWVVVPEPDNMTNLVAATTSYFTESDTADRWLITPPLILGDFGNFIKWDARSQDPSFPDDYLVLVSTTDIQITSFVDTIGSVKQENAEWTNREVNLSEKGFNGQTIYIAFVLRTFDGFKLYLDNIEVRKEDPLSVAEFTNNLVKVYPNPVNDVLQIDSEQQLNLWTIIDSKGTQIMQGLSNTIAVDSLKTGVYFIHWQSDKQSGVEKFFKN